MSQELECHTIKYIFAYNTRREYEDVFTQYFIYSIFILGRIYKWLFRAKIGAWFRMCGNTMGISTDVNSLSVKTNRERAMSIASTREMRNLIPGTCVPKHAKIFYILPKRDTQLTLEEDLKVFLYMAFIQKVLTLVRSLYNNAILNTKDWLYHHHLYVFLVK